MRFRRPRVYILEGASGDNLAEFPVIALLDEGWGPSDVQIRHKKWRFPVDLEGGDDAVSEIDLPDRGWTPSDVPIQHHHYRPPEFDDPDVAPTPAELTDEGGWGPSDVPIIHTLHPTEPEDANVEWMPPDTEGWFPSEVDPVHAHYRPVFDPQGESHTAIPPATNLPFIEINEEVLWFTVRRRWKRPVFDRSFDDSVFIYLPEFPKVDLVTKLDVWNMAAAELGIPVIQNVDEDTPQANLMRVVWNPVRRKYITMARPRSCRLTRILAPMALEPVARWSYQYVLPHNCILVLRVNGIDMDTSEGKWECEANPETEDQRLYVNTETATIQFVADIENMHHLMPGHVAALGLWLAASVARRSPKHESAVRGIEAKARAETAAAINEDGQQSGPLSYGDDSLIEAMGGWRDF